MRAVVVLFALALSAPLAGCFQCEPQLDVRDCTRRIAGCDPGAGRVVAWNPELDGLWPDVARLIETVEPDMHGHVDWTPEQAEAFWAFYQVPPGDGVHRQLFLSHEDELFRVRVLPC